MTRMIPFMLLVFILSSGLLLAAPPDSVRLEFTFDQNPAIYEESDYGEAPQVAIWLEDTLSGQVKTVYVTYRAATGDYYGKVECPVALPVWIAAWRRETGRDDYPVVRKPAAEAITKATSLDGKVQASAKVPSGTNWFCYIEMNVAGDFNSAYPFESQDGALDNHGNGQPSLIFRAPISAVPSSKAILEPYGRTEQHRFTGEIIRDFQGIDSALKCLSNITVFCTAE